MRHAATDPRQAQKARRQWEMGTAHARAERWDEALRAHRSAARLAPGDMVYALNHARALMARGDLAQAAEEAVRALQLDPGCLVARDMAVECLMRRQQAAEAVTLLRSLDPASRSDQTYHLLLGLALQCIGQPTQAIAAFFDGLSLGPGNAALHHNLGLSFADLNMKQEAAQCFRTAVLLGLGVYDLSSQALACYTERESCQWEDHDANMAALDAAVRALPPGASVPTSAFAHLAFTSDRAEQRSIAASAARHAAINVRPLPARRSDWQPGRRRLRIGYVSGDFHSHATSILMAEMLERHDRAHFEVRLYSHGPADDTPMRRRIEHAGEAFIDVQSMSDREVAERIRADGIDLLVDLKGHTSKSRFAIFAHRAAPLQISFLGFPGSTGADCIDYVVGDPVVTPLAHAADYSEKIAQMPVCYQPNDRQRRIPQPPTRASQGLPEGATVLCCFNQSYKISPAAFDSWCRVLHRVPEAVLWVLEWNAQVVPNLKREMQSRGIDPARLIGSPKLGLDAHIDRYVLADLFIDTWPYNAHTTASEALWAGVPVVSWLGETFASRVGTSLLQAVGLPELACRDIAGYEDTIVALATDAPRRAALRRHLVEVRGSAPLFDSGRFARDIEALYTRMALLHARGLPPEHLPATA